MAHDPATFEKQYGSFIGVMVGSTASMVVATAAALSLWMALDAWFDPHQVEGFVAFSAWFTSVIFSFAAVTGASVCVGTSRLIAPRRRAAATWISAAVLAIAVALLIADLILLLAVMVSAPALST